MYRSLAQFRVLLSFEHALEDFFILHKSVINNLFLVKTCWCQKWCKDCGPFFAVWDRSQWVNKRQSCAFSLCQQVHFNVFCSAVYSGKLCAHYHNCWMFKGKLNFSIYGFSLSPFPFPKPQAPRACLQATATWRGNLLVCTGCAASGCDQIKN